jgi:hypothetical protein
MKARGKREARRPWFIQDASFRPEGPKYAGGITPLSGLGAFLFVYQGRRASRLPLAFIFRAFGAVSPRLWRCKSAPLAL